MSNPSSLFATSAVNIIHFKDNQILKKYYDPNVKLDDEENFDKFEKKI